MVQHAFRFKKGIAIELRKKGLSYSEIENSISIPKSTVAYWVKDIKLSDLHLERLRKKRKEVAFRNSQKKIKKMHREAEELKVASIQNIQKISQRELWLMGLVLYWKEGQKINPKKGVQFASSNLDFLNLLLKWLREVGKISNEEIRFDILIDRGRKKAINQVVSYWAKAVGFPKKSFRNVYYYKRRSNPQARPTKGNLGINGILQIRVSASSLLARQISGWIEGIRTLLNS